MLDDNYSNRRNAGVHGASDQSCSLPYCDPYKGRENGNEKDTTNGMTDDKREEHSQHLDESEEESHFVA